MELWEQISLDLMLCRCLRLRLQSQEPILLLELE